MSADAPRYAIYFAPAANSPFWRFGCDWLGRDPETDIQGVRPRLEGPARADWDVAALEALTASPSNYGFHATLKPPFRLRAGQTLKSLEMALEAFAGHQKAFVCNDVRPAALGRFIAFRLREPSPELHAFASAVVDAFEIFRGPQTEAELAKRRAAGLTARQEAMLVQWGYPYVMEEFRFHMTLTSAIPDDGRRARLASSLEAMATSAGAVGPMPVDGLALYEQPAPAAPFRLLRRFPLNG